MSLTSESLYDIGLITVFLAAVAAVIIVASGGLRGESGDQTREDTPMWSPGSIGH